MIKFNCRVCSQKIGVKIDYAGKKVKCPKCSSVNVVPSAKSNPDVTPSSKVENDQEGLGLLAEFLQDAETAPRSEVQEKPRKACPSCGSIILKTAQKCRFCGEFLTENVEKQPPPKSKLSDHLDTELFGMLLLAIPVILMYIVWFWVRHMPLSDNPGGKLNLFFFIIVISTSIIAAIDHYMIRDPDEQVKNNLGPVGWFAFILLLWLIGYPAYLIKRARLGMNNYIIGGIFVVLMIPSLAIVLQTIISEQTISQVAAHFKNLGRGEKGYEMQLNVIDPQKSSLVDVMGASISYWADNRREKARNAPVPRMRPTRPTHEPLVTLAEFDFLEVGMSYRDVAATIGASGVEVSRSQVYDSVTIMYEWVNEDGSNMNAIFDDGKMVSKAQFGLK